MFEQAAQIKQHPPMMADFCSVSRPIEGVPAAGRFQAGQKGHNGRWNWDGVGAGYSSFRLRKGDCASMQIDQAEIQPGFAQSASRGVTNLKGNKHPFKARIHFRAVANKFSYTGDFVICEYGALAGRAFFSAVVNHCHGVNKTAKPTLPVDPFKSFYVVHSHISANGLAIGARMSNAPGNVLIRMDGGKFFQGYAMLINKSGKMPPAVEVVPFAGWADRVRLNHRRDPSVVRFDRPLSNGELGGLLLSLCPVKRVVGSVSSRFCAPLTIGGFVAQPEPLAVFSAVNSGHVTTVSNYSKTNNN